MSAQRKPKGKAQPWTPKPRAKRIEGTGDLKCSKGCGRVLAEYEREDGVCVHCEVVERVENPSNCGVCLDVGVLWVVYADGRREEKSCHSCSLSLPADVFKRAQERALGLGMTTEEYLKKARKNTQHALPTVRSGVSLRYSATGWRKCPRCLGRGKIEADGADGSCRGCGGHGEVPK